ncbi:aldo/keto reductase [Pseudohoeflea coraliihabitans]|uniref:Aldo/keto reductase n=1 Tax=Pseudohoeflea coraliihabitans TaxID=2860393 RepID=A0ABS6WRY8_9HYPH|nr:aldo/keto reductase [Pseudohoeflea sp. DP4N28-3]MBW3098696.1 aldo/keto reductase [Pseudohoeflea sp. DP4N28-3]
MKMNRLGRTDLRVSEICLGTMTFGEQNTEAEAHAQMDRAVAAGVNFFDAAEMYPTNPLRAETQGRTEEYIGSWLQQSGKRGDVVLASKITGEGNEWIRGGEMISRAAISRALDASLKRLKTDCIDLYQLHWPNRGSFHFRKNWRFDASKQATGAAMLDDLADTLRGLDDAIKAGKIRAYGLSNDSSWGIMQMLRLAEMHDLPRAASVQNEYNLLYRHFDLDLAEVAHHEDVGLLAYSPLAAGILTGKYQGGVIPEGSRRSRTEKLGGRWTAQTETAVDAYLEVARRHDLDPAQMALAFCLSRPFMTSVIIGATTLEQLETALGAVDVQLSEEVHKEIARLHRKFPMPF